MSRVGSILGLIGACLITFGGIWVNIQINQLEQELSQYHITLDSLGIDTEAINIMFLVSILFGIIGIVGAIIGLAGKNFGNWILLGVGIFTIIGSFIMLVPAERIDITGGYVYFPAIPLVGSVLITDPYLITIGGILGVVSGKSQKSDEDDDWTGMTKEMKKSRKKWQKEYG